MKRFVVGLLLSIGLFLAMPAEVAAQCAMCRATVSSNVVSKESKVGTGLNTGILYLMAIPYVLVGTVGFIWYRSNKQKKKEAQRTGIGQI